MAITGQARRRRIVINADAYISSATSNVPVLVKFNSTSHPDLFGTGDDKDSVWFSSDAGGQTTLYHEGVVFSATDAIFYVKVDLSSTADTVIYFWYGTPSITGTESKADVWTNAVTIAHYVTDETNPTATVGTDGTKTNATFTASGRAVGGAYTTASNGYITHGTITPTSISVIFWIKKNGCSKNYTKIIGELFESGANVTGWEMDIPVASTGYVRFGRLSTTDWSSWKSATVSTSIKDNGWHLVAGTYDRTNIKLSIDGGTQRSTSATGSIVYTYGFTLNVGRSGINSGTNEEETFDNIWVFSDAKSLDWIKAVYNNVQNYSTFITIDGAVSIGSSPIQVYPVWPISGPENYEGTVTAGLGIAGAVSTQSDFNRSVSSGIGIAAAVTHTGTLSRSVGAGLGISASATLQRSYSKSVDAGLGIAGAISTSATFSRSVEAGLGIAGEVSTSATFSRSVEAGIGISADVAYSGYEKETNAGIGISGEVYTLLKFARSFDFGIGIAATVGNDWPTYTENPEGGIGISATVEVAGDFSIPKYWGISILHGATTTDLYGENIIESASITDQLGKRSDEFEIRLYNNEGTYSESFAIGDDVYFYLGYTENPTTKIFHGVITSIEFDLPRVNENTMIIQGVDYGTFRLGQTMVAGIQEYINMTPTAIIQSLLNNYCPDITYTNVATFVDKIPNIRFAWEYVGDCVEMLATLVGADFYVDENDDLHFYDNSTMTSDHTISSDELISARIQKDSYKHYDRVYVIGGKEKYLDVNNATATTAIDTYAKYYASAFTVSKNNLLYVSAYIKKVGEMIEDLPFEIVEDDGAGDPLGDVVAWGKFPVDNISTDAAWVQSTMIDAQLSTAMTYWIVFKLVGRDSSNTYQIYHDNATANGHEDSDDGTSSWTDRTGLLAFKTYYGVQIIKSSTASQKIAGEYYTDILVADPNIEDFSTAEDLATQKVAEYALKHTSDLVVKSKFERFRSGDVVSLSITGLPALEDQTILSTSMEFTESTISTVEIQTTPTIDFYNTFAGLFADLRKLKIKAMYLDSNLSNDYLAGSETVTPADSATIIEAATDYTPQYDDTEAIWDVSKWQ